MATYTQGKILANTKNIDIVAQDPGDIMASFSPSTTSESPAGIPASTILTLKAFTCDKTVDVTVLYGTGSHQGYQKTYGKVGYKGSFTLNSWADQKEKAKLERLLYSQYEFEGTPLEWDCVLYDRMNVSESGAGAGVYNTDPIVTVSYCTLTGDGIDIGEPGTPIATKFDFVALRRTPL